VLPFETFGLRNAADRDIFMAGRMAGAVIVTKDADFVRLLEQLRFNPTREVCPP
jgi:predicted nuclease of predicted toxin-antitoxin system